MRPSLVLAGLLGGSLALLGLLAAAFPEAGLVWWLPLVVVGLPAVGDLVAGWRMPPVRADRQVAPVLGHHRTASVVLTLRSEPALPRWLRVFDGVPAVLAPAGLPVRLDNRRREASRKVAYEVRPLARGDARFSAPWIDHPSPWGLWIRRCRPATETAVRVFPDRPPVGRGSLDLPAGVAGSGSHRVRRRGLGLEFHQLREYRQGDLGRMIDGKASSRLGRLVVREMQEEQDQNVVFLLDTGYRMTDLDRGVRHFDRAFDAVLGLAAVALKQGDRVGVLTWGPDSRWIPPVRGAEALPRLIERLYDVEARPEASSPTAALRELLPRLTRRTLLVLVTNFREEDGEDLAPLLPLIRSKHLLCTVWLREPFVETWTHRAPRQLEQALGTVAAVQYETDRLRGRRRAEAQGVLTLDVTPENLRGELINQYWRIKRRGLL